MARRSRMSVLKRQREAQKRQRERRKSEKAALKRERRHGKKPGTVMASREELIGLGIVQPEEATGEESESESETESESGDGKPE